MKCCERDYNDDGNCDIHSAPGVFRNWRLQPTPVFNDEVRRWLGTGPIPGDRFVITSWVDVGAFLRIIVREGKKQIQCNIAAAEIGQHQSDSPSLTVLEMIKEISKA